MNYKELNVYQRCYKVAIYMHLYLNGSGNIIPDYDMEGLMRNGREIFSDIAESVNNGTPKGKRYFIFKALQSIDTTIKNIEFLVGMVMFDKQIANYLIGEYKIATNELLVMVGKKTRENYRTKNGFKI